MAAENPNPTPAIPQGDIAVFVNRVSVSNGCWLWNGPTHRRSGYGMIHFGAYPRRRKTMAHRVSWEIFRGPIPVGLCVLHRCDIPACVRPSHLFLGSHDDNMADMKRKGRARVSVGVANPRARLNEKDVVEIRRCAREGVDARVTAARFGICRWTVYRIVRRVLWAHVP